MRAKLITGLMCVTGTRSSNNYNLDLLQNLLIFYTFTNWLDSANM